MPSADRLDEFTTIVAEGSISAAARALDMPRATLSRRLADLEAELGVRLIHRRTRSLVLTDAGRELARRAGRIIADTAEAWDAVRRLDDTPRGRLHVSVSSGLAPDLFLDFLREFPEVSLVVRSTTRHVDLLGEGVDVAIRYGTVHDPDLIVRRLATIRSLVVAAPAYLQQRGTPRRPEDLAEHDCVRHVEGDGKPERAWPCIDGGTVAINGRLASNDSGLLIAAALRGDGLALIPGPLVDADLRAGRLVAVLEEHVGTRFPVSLVYADRAFVPPKVRAFVDRAVEQLPRWFAQQPAA